MSRSKVFDGIPSVAKPRGIVSRSFDHLKSLFFTLDSDDRVDETIATQSPQCDQVEATLETFTNLMEVAADIASRNANGLTRLVTALMLPIQAEQILSVAERGPHGARQPIRFDQLLSPDYFFSYFDTNHCVRMEPEQFRVSLTCDIVLTTPWTRKGFASALSHIGSGKSSGPWRQDSNHDVTLLLPWRIAFVNGGNHSIAAGILGNEGTVKPSTVLDFSPLFRLVACDGKNYFDIASGRPVARMENGRMGALFEIGRLMSEHLRVSSPQGS